MRKTPLDYGLLALLLWSPLPAASVEEWSLFVIELAAAVLAAAYLFLDHPPAVNPHLSPLFRKLKPAVIALFGFLAFQIVPLPVAVVRILSPGSYGFRKLYAPEFAGMKFMSLSIVPSATLGAALFLAALFILGFLVLRTVGRGREIRTMLAVLVASGVFQALYGLFELTRDDPRILFYKKMFSPESVTGTFVNRNHLSGYLEMLVPLAIGLAIARMNMMTFGIRGLREKLLLWTSKGILVNVLILAGAVVMSLAILLSNSRTGLAVLAFTVFLFFGFPVAAFSRTGFRQPWIGKTIRTTFLCVTILALTVGVGSTIRRFALDNLLHEDRPQYWANTAGIVRDFPLFGTGLGTFASAYGAYETMSATERQLLHAHNDYLEYASELGLIGFLLLAGIVVTIAVSAYLAWRGRRNPQARALALGGIVSLAGMGLHAVTDFNLHIPANMVLFTVVLCLTLVMAYYRKSGGPA
jgi:O-antigen ligase